MIKKTAPDLTINCHNYADVLPPNQQRWTKAKKFMIVSALAKNIISFEGACSFWGLTKEELALWQKHYSAYGINSLKIGTINALRRHERTAVRPC